MLSGCFQDDAQPRRRAKFPRPYGSPACFGTGQDLRGRRRTEPWLQRGEVAEVGEVVVFYATTEAVHENSGSTGLEHLGNAIGSGGLMESLFECVKVWVVLGGYGDIKGTTLAIRDLRNNLL